LRTLEHTIYYGSRSDTTRLYDLTDLHIGARASMEDLLQSDVDAIAADPAAYWLGGGDYIDCIARKNDRRYNESTLAKWLRGKDDVIGMQRDRVVEILSPIAKKCVGLVCGNHERAALDYADRDVYWEIVTLLSKAANVEPQKLALGVQGFVNLRFRRGTLGAYGGSWVMTLFTHHGFGGGRTPGGHALTLGRAMGDYDADLLLFGHRHVRQFVDKVIVAPGYKQRLKIAMFIPSYLGAYVKPSTDDKLTDTYAEMWGLPPQHLGTVPIIIKPDVRKMDVVFSSVAGISRLDEETSDQRKATAA
jgi:hypothetical protein